AVFAALPSADPSTPTATITATMAAGSGIPAATATCAFGSVDRRCCRRETPFPTWRSTPSRLLRRKRRRRSAAPQIPRTGISRSAGNRIRSDARIRGRRDHAAQFARELFEARGQVYRGADAGEIEPVSAADVAIQDVADVKRQSKTHAADFNSGRPIQRSDVSARLVCAGQCAGANLRGVAVVSNWEDGQQAVAHEFENFAAMLE